MIEISRNFSGTTEKYHENLLEKLMSGPIFQNGTFRIRNTCRSVNSLGKAFDAVAEHDTILKWKRFLRKGLSPALIYYYYYYYYYY
jgi:hypothetical protein